MKHFSPTFRLSVSLAVLVLSLLLFAETFGLIPDTRGAMRDARQKTTESLAVQLSIATTRSEFGIVTATLDAFVRRSADVRSAAIRRVNGEIIAQAGDHALHWVTNETERSTLNHVLVPILAGEKRWGSMEIAFAPPTHDNWLIWLRETGVGLLLFVAVSGFLAFYFVLRRALRVLDPRQVIPQRVKTAFDSLTEGVLILDEKAQIVLANEAFALRSGIPHDRLLGLRAAELHWKDPSEDARPAQLPWEQTINNSVTQTRVPLRLADAKSGDLSTLLTTSTAVMDQSGRQRGTLITFNDITQTEAINQQLLEAVAQLTESEHEIRRKNEQLLHLATRDSLTGCLNRRAFFSAFEPLYARVASDGIVLSCLMVDIDNFKSVNDRFGHDVGDKVIKWVAETIESHVRAEDLVCRYGGEEFCVVLSGLGMFQANGVAQNIRRTIEDNANTRFGGELPVTVSIGLSSVHLGANTPAELITQADYALYEAKSGGRNRVVRWTAESVAAPGVHASARRAARGNPAEDASLAALDPMALAAASNGEKRFPGLSERIEFADRIERAQRHSKTEGKLVAVLSLVPNQYRRVTETLGPAVASALLDEIGKRLSETLRRSDAVVRLSDSETLQTVSRLGPDEFGVLLTGLADEDAAREVIRRILRAMAQPLKIRGHALEVEITIGVALATDSGQTPESLLRNAAEARHHARESGKNERCAFYSSEMGTTSLRRMRIGHELRQALNSDQLDLHYQPQKDMGTGEISGWEVLARWTHPELGPISPAEFVKIAEQTSLIHQLGIWVLRAACRQANTWAQEGLDVGRIAVNVSAVQLQHPDIIPAIRSVLTETGLPGDRLELEVTESAILHDKSQAETTLRQLKRLGVRISIDDFGTGYSGLTYIKNFPADSVKIDRSFLKDVLVDPRSAELYHGIVDMGRRLNLYVISEGVESQEELAFVARTGCNAIQGFLLSAPLAASEAEQFWRMTR